MFASFAMIIRKDFIIVTENADFICFKGIRTIIFTFLPGCMKIVQSGKLPVLEQQQTS
jgi:hypothetical protein